LRSGTAAMSILGMAVFPYTIQVQKMARNGTRR
jgi:hypothetical protein